MTANWDLIEQWSITVSSEAPAPRRIRYLAPEGKTSRLRIYVEQGGVWQSVPFETVGSYAVFSIPAASARIAARVDHAGLVDLGGDSTAACTDYFPDDPLHSEGCAQIEAETRGAKRAAERPARPRWRIRCRCRQRPAAARCRTR